MIKIDLNPQKKKKSRKPVLQGFSLSIDSLRNLDLSGLTDKVIYLIPVALISTTVAWYFYVNKEYSKLQEEKKNLQAEINRYKVFEVKAKQIKDKLSKLLEEEKKIELKVKIFETLANQRKSITPVINSVVTKIPDGVWLENLNVSEDGKVILTAYSLSPENITVMYKSLSYSFNNVAFSKVKDKQEVQGIVKVISPLNIIYYKFSLELSKFKAM